MQVTDLASEKLDVLRSPLPLPPSGLEIIAEIIGKHGQEESLAAQRFTSTEAKLLLIGRERMYERLNTALSDTKAGKGTWCNTLYANAAIGDVSSRRRGAHHGTGCILVGAERRDRLPSLSYNSASIHGSKGEAISRQSLPFVILTRADRARRLSDVLWEMRGERKRERERAIFQFLVSRSRYRLNKRAAKLHERKHVNAINADAIIPQLENPARFDDSKRNGTDGIVIVPSWKGRRGWLRNRCFHLYIVSAE